MITQFWLWAKTHEMLAIFQWLYAITYHTHWAHNDLLTCLCKSELRASLEAVQRCTSSKEYLNCMASMVARFRECSVCLQHWDCSRIQCHC